MIRKIVISMMLIYSCMGAQLRVLSPYLLKKRFNVEHDWHFAIAYANFGPIPNGQTFVS